MSSQLDQILAYLDRDGVTEILIGNGRPVTFRRNHENIGLTKEPLSKAQLATLLKGTALYHLVPDRDGTKPGVEIAVGERMCKITASRRGDEVAFRIEPVGPSMGGLELSPEIPGGKRRSRNSIPVDTKPATARTSTRSKRTSIPVANEPPTSARTRTPTRGARTTTTPDTRAKRGSKPAISVPTPAADFDLELDQIEVVGMKQPTSAMPVISAKPASSSGPPGSFTALVATARQRGASDLHIATARPISVRVLGELQPIDPRPVSATEVDALLRPLLSPEHVAQLDKAGYVDLALEAPGGGRLRTNISKFQGGLKGTFRLAREAPSTLEELSLPRDLAKLVSHHQGLVVVAGPSGHGKTTTLAALVDLINASKPHHIITVEDPIEIVYARKAAVVSQREVGPHTRSFAAALKGSLREDPDVIVIGELRDRETVEIALTAAETGHLVIATMSTPNAAKTIDRLVDMFPPEDQSQVRASIAGALRAIVAQRLLPSAGGDRIYPAVEVLTGVLALASLIREDKLFQLPNLMQRGKAFGMIRFDDSLIELVRANKITADTALATTDNKKELAVQLRGGAAPPAAAPPPEGEKKRGLAGLFGRKDS